MNTRKITALFVSAAIALLSLACSDNHRPADPTPVQVATIEPTATALPAATATPTITLDQKLKDGLYDGSVGGYGDFVLYLKSYQIDTDRADLYIGYERNSNARIIPSDRNVAKAAMSVFANAGLFPMSVTVTVEHLQHKKERGEFVFSIVPVSTTYICTDDLSCYPENDPTDVIYCNPTGYHDGVYCGFME